MSAVERPITGFSQDSQGHWVAELGCGHRRHVRHRPPWELRPWVLSEEGRSEHLGGMLPCVRCTLPVLPARVTRYQVLGPFSETALPAGALQSHTLEPGVWGRIVVLEGALVYVLEREPDVAFELRAGDAGVIPPEEPHRVETAGAVRFEIELFSAGAWPKA